MAVKVTLRKKKLKNGKLSLYLDFYPAISKTPSGETTRREFLRLSCEENPSNTEDKAHKIKMLKVAEGIRQRRELELNKPEIYSEWEREQLKFTEAGEKSFVEYFKNMAWEKTGGNHGNWISALKYLQNFAPDDLRFNQLDTHILEKLKRFLLSSQSIKSPKIKLDQNSASSYFSKYRAALKSAYREGLIRTDWNAKISGIKTKEHLPENLSSTELQQLADTKCADESLKKAAIFSALTGLRFSDIKNLTWENIHQSEKNVYYLKISIQKTGRTELMPVQDLAIMLLGGGENKTGKVLPDLKYSAHQNKKLHAWVQDAGISRHITFHHFRHTYATLQLTGGTDLYTISKLLGHKNIKTTQVYAKVVDQLKVSSINKIKLDYEV